MPGGMSRGKDGGAGAGETMLDARDGDLVSEV